MPLSESSARRSAALAAAIDTHRLVGDLPMQWGDCAEHAAGNAAAAVRRTAELFDAWLEGPIQLFIVPGEVFDKETGQPIETDQEGDTMQINTGQGFYFALKGRDRSGYVTTIPDTEVTTDNASVTVLSRVTSEPGKWRVLSGDPGDSTLTVSLPPLQEGGEPRSARLVVDVVPGDAVAVEFEIGDVFDEESEPNPETPAEPNPEPAPEQ